MEEKYSKEFWIGVANALLDLCSVYCGSEALVTEALAMGYSKEEVQDVFYDDAELIEKCYKKLFEE